MITLRPNQAEPINKAIDFFKEKNPAPSIIVLPTAWGKSILAAYVAKNVDGKLLVVVPNKELLQQNYDKYMALCGDVEPDCAIFSASLNSKRIGRVTFATIGSIKNLGQKFQFAGFTKMLIDEVHIFPRESESMLGRFLKESGITHVLGITATPIKLQNNVDKDGNPFSKLQMLTARSKKGNFFKEIIHVSQVQEMVQMGFWSKLIYRKTKFDNSRLVYNSQKSEYTDESVRLSFNSNHTETLIFKALDHFTERKHILVFVPSVEEALSMSSKYNSIADDYHHSAAAIYGDMPKKDREQIINSFRDGKIRVIFNCFVLSTGFDYPGVDCIILASSTASVARYYQIIGRATRIHPDKQDALIVDLGGNIDRFGKVEDIMFEKSPIANKWMMYGSNGNLLSGVPIHEIGNHDRDTVRMEEQAKKDADEAIIEIMPYGKHKGERIVDIPENYRKWVLQNFDWKPSQKGLKRSIARSLLK